LYLVFGDWAAKLGNRGGTMEVPSQLGYPHLEGKGECIQFSNGKEDAHKLFSVLGGTGVSVGVLGMDKEKNRV